MTVLPTPKVGPLLVYISGPYTAATLEETERNVERAIDAGIVLIRKGHFPFIPHLSHYVEMRAVEVAGQTGQWTNVGIPYETWLRQDRVWMKLCDGLLLLAHSPGADRELEAAQALGLPIWTDVESVPEDGVGTDVGIGEGNRGL